MLLRDSNGMTACDLADKAGHVDCTAVLKEAAGKLILCFVANIIGEFWSSVILGTFSIEVRSGKQSICVNLRSMSKILNKYKVPKADNYLSSKEVPSCL